MDNSTEDDEEEDPVDEKEEERKTRRTTKGAIDKKKGTPTSEPKVERISIKIPSLTKISAVANNATSSTNLTNPNGSGEDAAFRYKKKFVTVFTNSPTLLMLGRALNAVYKLRLYVLMVMGELQVSLM